MPLSFLAFVFLVCAEYLGLGNYVPGYDALHAPLILSFLLIVMVIARHGFGEVLEHKQAKYYILFVILTAAGMAHGLIQSNAITPTKQQVGYLALMIIGFYLVDDTKKINFYAFMFVLTHIIVTLVNFEKLGNQRSGYFTAGFFLGDGNDFAWSLNIALPFSLFFLLRADKKIVKLFSLGATILLLIGIVGTQSRGASLALMGGFLYYMFYISEKKMRGVLLLIVVASSILLFAPPEYLGRLETISAYEEDTSATARLKAWRTATDMAVDNPILGVGAGSFNSAYGRFYRRSGDPVRWISTHSVYFKVLGEYGFVGLFIYLMVIYHNLATNRRTRAIIQDNPGLVSVDKLWPDVLNMSIVACSIAAMFLSGLNYPHLFLLTMLTMATSRMVSTELLIEDSSSTDKEVSSFG